MSYVIVYIIIIYNRKQEYEFCSHNWVTVSESFITCIQFTFILHSTITHLEANSHVATLTFPTYIIVRKHIVGFAQLPV